MKDPFSWPKSSDSAICSAIAVEFMVMKGTDGTVGRIMDCDSGRIVFSAAALASEEYSGVTPAAILT